MAMKKRVPHALDAVPMMMMARLAAASWETIWHRTLMMAQGADRIFHRGGTMRIRRWAQRRITHRCEIER